MPSCLLHTVVPRCRMHVTCSASAEVTSVKGHGCGSPTKTHGNRATTHIPRPLCEHFRPRPRPQYDCPPRPRATAYTRTRTSELGNDQDVKFGGIVRGCVPLDAVDDLRSGTHLGHRRYTACHHTRTRNQHCAVSCNGHQTIGRTGGSWIRAPRSQNAMLGKQFHRLVSEHTCDECVAGPAYRREGGYARRTTLQMCLNRSGPSWMPPYHRETMTTTSLTQTRDAASVSATQRDRDPAARRECHKQTYTASA